MEILLVCEHFRPSSFIAVTTTWGQFCLSLRFPTLYDFFLTSRSCILFYEPKEMGLEHKLQEKEFLVGETLQGMNE